jgi:Protein  of unknown function (DUF3018)
MVMSKRKISGIKPHVSHGAAQRMATYRQRMRGRGLRPVQIWLPDMRDPALLSQIMRECDAIAASNAGGDTMLRELELVHEWPAYE